MAQIGRPLTFRANFVSYALNRQSRRCSRTSSDRFERSTCETMAQKAAVRGF